MTKSCFNLHLKIGKNKNNKCLKIDNQSYIFNYFATGFFVRPCIRSIIIKWVDELSVLATCCDGNKKNISNKEREWMRIYKVFSKNSVRIDDWFWHAAAYLPLLVFAIVSGNINVTKCNYFMHTHLNIICMHLVYFFYVCRLQLRTRT